ncbi:MAG: hypothetical protein NTY98_18745 [Verrucomicrobia bacterium]|nr:hypothetical protein [Verrucomicrobiota bacterium]
MEGLEEEQGEFGIEPRMGGGFTFEQDSLIVLSEAHDSQAEGFEMVVELVPRDFVGRFFAGVFSQHEGEEAGAGVILSGFKLPGALLDGLNVQTAFMKVLLADIELKKMLEGDCERVAF